MKRYIRMNDISGGLDKNGNAFSSMDIDEIVEYEDEIDLIEIVEVRATGIEDSHDIEVTLHWKDESYTSHQDVNAHINVARKEVEHDLLSFLKEIY